MNFKVIVTFLILLQIITAEELDRDTRALNSQGFKALIELGKIINEFGIENIENYIQGFLNLISRNLLTVYVLIFGVILAHFLTFFLTLIALKPKKLKYNLRSQEVKTENEETNDRQYWPAIPFNYCDSCETRV